MIKRTSFVLLVQIKISTLQDAVLVKDLFLTQVLQPWCHVNECNI